jgi:hypothetical protein
MRCPAGRRGRRFQQVTQLVFECRDAPQVAPFDGTKHGIHFVDAGNRQAIDQAFKTPSGGRSLRSPPIFEKCVERRAYLRFR